MRWKGGKEEREGKGRGVFTGTRVSIWQRCFWCVQMCGFLLVGAGSYNCLCCFLSCLESHCSHMRFWIWKVSSLEEELWIMEFYGMGWDEMRWHETEWNRLMKWRDWRWVARSWIHNDQYCQVVVDGYLTVIHPEVGRRRWDTLHWFKGRNWKGCFHWDQEIVDSYAGERYSCSWAWSWSWPSLLWMGEIVLMKSPHLSLPKRLNKRWCTNSIPTSLLL